MKKKRLPYHTLLYFNSYSYLLGVELLTKQKNSITVTVKFVIFYLYMVGDIFFISCNLTDCLAGFLRYLDRGYHYGGIFVISGRLWIVNTGILLMKGLLGFFTIGQIKLLLTVLRGCFS